MSSKTLVIEIEAGEKTCASEPGTFCQWLYASCFGGGYCTLLGQHLAEEDGWLLRCPLCLSLEKE